MFINGLHKVLIEFAYDPVEPSPIFRYRLKDHCVAVASNVHFVALKTKFLRQPDRLGSPRPENLCPLHELRLVPEAMIYGIGSGSLQTARLRRYGADRPESNLANEASGRARYGSENSWIVLDAAIGGLVKRVLAPANSM